MVKEVLKIGDVVKLNSDSPKMTVTSIGIRPGLDDYVSTFWIDREGTERSMSAYAPCFSKVS